MGTHLLDIFTIEDLYERSRAYLDYFKEHGERPFSINRMFKEVYGDLIKDLIPGSVKLLNKMQNTGFDAGSLYHQPVILGTDHGVKFEDEE